MKRFNPVRQGLKQTIKRKAGELINAQYPEWKQRNILARTVELQELANTRVLTDAEQAEKNAAQSVWDSIKAIRTHSNTLEAAVDNGQTVDIESGWPT